MLYARYSRPMDLVERYIQQRRFGKFVQGFMEAEYERKKHEAERDQDMMLWIAYSIAINVGHYSGSFGEYKQTVMKPASTTRRRGSDVNMTERDVQSIVDGLFRKPQE